MLDRVNTSRRFRCKAEVLCHLVEAGHFNKEELQKPHLESYNCYLISGITKKKSKQNNCHMAKKRQTRGIELIVTESADEILSEIKRRSDLQIENASLLIWEPVDYTKFVIKENQICIERSPGILHPFRGFGSITISLQSGSEGTKLNCVIDPNIKTFLGGLIYFLLFSLVMTILAIFTLREQLLAMFSIIILLWIIPIGGVYIGHIMNVFKLENYLDSILTDLGFKNKTGV